MTERLSNKNPCSSCKVDRQIGNPNRWECECDSCDKPIDWKNDCVKKLAEYETSEKDGRLVVLPCKVGDMVYVIAPNHRLCEAKHDCDEYDYENYLISWCEKFCPYGYKGIGVIKDIISHIEIRDNGICYCTTNCGYLYDDKVFLTREEAEKALKEMEGKA